MKKKLLVAFMATISTVCCVFGATACNGDTHKHTFETGYSGYDNEYHWHKATCEHTSEKSGKEAHSYTGNSTKCDKCAFNKSGGQEDPDSEKTYKTVTFNLNGGNGVIEPMQFAVGEVMSDLPVPTRDGYRFICWEDFSEEYTAASVMPNGNLSLKAKWEKVLSSYEDKYVSFKPATTGCKNEDVKLDYDEADKYVYVEITSDDLGGVNEVGKTNNFSLRKIEGMEYNVNAGYTMLWYRSDFETVNAAQRFTLDYGSNVQFVTVSDSNGNVQQTYLVDIYVKHDYYVSLYKNIIEENPYDKVRVVENERFAADTEVFDYKNGFEFDSRVYYNEGTNSYQKYVYSMPVTKNWELYQTYKPVTIEAALDGGTLEDEISITPYTQYFTLPSPEKEGFDFIGWQTEDGKYLTNVQGYAGDKYLSAESRVEKLVAIYAKKQMYYTFDNETLKTYSTVPVVTYTDKSMTEILEIVYTPYNENCALPVKTVQGDGQIFRGWQYYAVNNEGKFNIAPVDFFGVERKITAPVALVPEFDTAGNTVIPLNEEKTLEDVSAYSMYLPAAKAYTLKITASDSVTFTLSTLAGSSEAKHTYTVTSAQSLTVQVSNYRYELGNQKVCGGSATLTVTSLSGSFTALFSGDTANVEGTPAVTNENNLSAVGEAYTPVLDNPGYIFTGWYINEEVAPDTDVEKITTVPKELTYSAKWVSVGVEFNEDAGTVTDLCDTYVFGEEVTLAATTNAGYTWVGWYKGNTKITEETEYTFTMPNEETVFAAKWSKVNIIALLNGEPEGAGAAGSITSLTDTYTVDEEITLTAIPNGGYKFIGWFKDDLKLTEELNYTFFMPDEDVTYIANWEENYSYLDEVFEYTLQDGVYTITGIIDKSVKEISVPSYVDSIESGAFSGCSELESITLPFIGNFAKKGDYARNLFGIIFGNKQYEGSIATRQEYGAEGNQSISYYIPASLKTVNIMGGNVYYGAFSNCSGLETINIPEEITSIAPAAFKNCSGLTTFNISENVTFIGEYAFRGCSKLTDITIPDSVTGIDYMAFGYTGYYKDSNNRENGLLYINNHLIDADSDITGMCTVKQGTRTIAAGAFNNGCNSFTSIVIPDSVITIAGWSFYNCKSLEKVYYDGSSEMWGKLSIWSNNSSLTSAKKYYYSESKPTEAGNYWHYVDGEVVEWQ